MSTPRNRLPVKPSIESLKKHAKRLAKRLPSMSLQQAQHQLAKSYDLANWEELLVAVSDGRRNADQVLQRLIDDGAFAPYRRIAFSVESVEGVEHPALHFQVREVYGTSTTVAVGERCVVRGEYELSGRFPHAISLAVCTKAFGAGARLLPGAGSFEVGTEILALMKQSPNELGIVVGNEKTGKGKIVSWIKLKR